MLTGDNGILKKTGEAKEKTVQSGNLEQLTLVANDWETEKLTKPNTNIETYLEKQVVSSNIDEYESIGDGLYIIKKGDQELTLDDGKVYVWDGSASTELRGSGTEDDPFLIKNGADLAFLSNAVNNGGLKYTDKNGTQRLYQFACYKQIKDICLNDISDYEMWDKDDYDKTDLNEYIFQEKIFCGGYDGNNHTITGLYINQPTKSNLGLFSELYRTTSNYKITDCYVRNINLKNLLIIGKSNIGSIGGRSTSTEISECNVSGKIISKNEGWYYGGIVGNTTKYGDIQNKILGCKSSVTITTTGCFVGGILGYTWNDALIENCENTGNITAQQSVGGIGGCTAKATVRDCNNSGNLYNCSGVTTSLYYFGGISGQTDGGNDIQARIERCNNSGSIFINGNQNDEHFVLDIGGIAGRAFRTVIINSNNSGNITINARLKESDSYSRGFGGILGEGGTNNENAPVIANCINSGTIRMMVNSIPTVGNIIGTGEYKTSEE